MEGARVFFLLNLCTGVLLMILIYERAFCFEEANKNEKGSMRTRTTPRVLQEAPGLQGLLVLLCSTPHTSSPSSSAFKTATLEAPQWIWWRIPRAGPCSEPVLTLLHAFQLRGSCALISWHTKDSSKYSLSAATAASVLMSI